MTVREAIDCIDAVLSADVNYDESIDFNLFSLDKEWLEKAKEALELTEKKKPILKDHDHDEYFSKSVECGNCGAALGSWNYGRELYNGSKEWFIEENRFCRRCGRKIFWEDETNDSKRSIENR